MKIHHFRKWLVLIVALFLGCNILQAKPIRVLVITGGHAYKAEPVYQMPMESHLKTNPEKFNAEQWVQGIEGDYPLMQHLDFIHFVKFKNRYQ